MVSLSALLEILKPIHTELPKDPRTLLKTVNTAEIQPLIKNVFDGSYYHFGIVRGIESQLHKHGSEIIKDNAILLQINIDGVPLFKSTNVYNHIRPI
jgi:hypothetical protein